MTDVWKCGACTYDNRPNKRRCEVCGHRKPVVRSSDVTGWLQNRKRKRSPSSQHRRLADKELPEVITQPRTERNVSTTEPAVLSSPSIAEPDSVEPILNNCTTEAGRPTTDDTAVSHSSLGETVLLARSNENNNTAEMRSSKSANVLPQQTQSDNDDDETTKENLRNNETDSKPSEYKHGDPSVTESSTFEEKPVGIPESVANSSVPDDVPPHSNDKHRVDSSLEQALVDDIDSTNDEAVCQHEISGSSGVANYRDETCVDHYTADGEKPVREVCSSLLQKSDMKEMLIDRNEVGDNYKCILEESHPDGSLVDESMSHHVHDSSDRCDRSVEQRLGQQSDLSPPSRNSIPRDSNGSNGQNRGKSTCTNDTCDQRDPDLEWTSSQHSDTLSSQDDSAPSTVPRSLQQEHFFYTPATQESFSSQTLPSIQEQTFPNAQLLPQLDATLNATPSSREKNSLSRAASDPKNGSYKKFSEAAADYSQSDEPLEASCDRELPSREHDLDERKRLVLHPVKETPVINPSSPVVQNHQLIAGGTCTSTIDRGSHVLLYSKPEEETTATMNFGAVPEANADFLSVGSRTAGSRTSVKVSESSIQKASRLLSRTEIEENQAEAASTAPLFIFRTAGSKASIEVTDSSIEKAGRLLGRTETGGKQDEVSSTAPFVGFRTAGLKTSIKVSDASIEKASRLLSGRVDETEVQIGVTSNTPRSGFRTAGSQTIINVSDSSIEKANELLGDRSDARRFQDDVPGRAPLAEFATARSNVSVKVHGSSIATNKSFYDGIEFKGQSKDINACSSPFVGFLKAGSNVSIVVSDASMAKACKILRGPVDSGGTGGNQTGGRKICASVTSGFQTAGSGTAIDVSDTSIEHASRLLEKVSDFHIGNHEVQEVDALVTTTHVSDSSIERVSRLSVRNDFSNESLSFVGFQTAGSRTSIKVSAASLEKAQSVLETHEVIRDDTPLVGFQTAGSKTSIKVSVASLEKAQSVLETRKSAKEDTPRVQFQTAGSKTSIKVSAASLEKANEVLRRKRFVESSPSSTSLEETISPMALLVGSQRSSSVTQPAETEPRRKKRISFAGAAKSDLLTPRLKIDALSADRSVRGNVASKDNFVTPHVPRAISDHESSRQSGFAPTNFRFSFGVEDQRVLTKDAATGRSSGVVQNYSRRVTIDPSSFCGQRAVDTPARSMFDLPVDLNGAAPERSESMLSFSDCVNLGVNDIVLRVSSSNASHVRYDPKSRRPIGFLDSSPDNGVLGTVDDFRSRLISNGCVDKLLKKRWIPIHSRWITWKLASIERRFSDVANANGYLTFDRVCEQLLLRYHKEIVGGKRPAIRKIANRDVSPIAAMILCVAQITINLPRDSGSKIEGESDQKETVHLEVTDGWYSLPAVPDAALAEFVRSGRIRVGTKLAVSNCVLSGFEDGIDPLDAGFDPDESGTCPVLRIFANSTRIARWNAKLGFIAPWATPSGGLVVKKVSDVIDGGGRIPVIDLSVTLRNPMLYLERQEENQDGQKARILTEQEELERLEYNERRRHQLVEEVYDEVVAECIKDVDEGAPDVWHRLQKEGSESLESLSTDTRYDLDQWMARRSSLLPIRIRQELDAKLEEHGLDQEASLPFLKLTVKSVEREGNDVADETMQEACLTVWNPSKEQLDLLQNSAVLRFKNLDTRGRGYDDKLQLSANSKTQIEKVESFKRQVEESSEEYSNLVKVSLASKRLGDGHRKPAINVFGVVLAVHIRDAPPQWAISFADRSRLKLRIQGSRTAGDLQTRIGHLSQEPFSVVEFQQLALLPFDHSERVAVAEFGEHSILNLKPAFIDAASLRRWSRSASGRRQLRDHALYANIGVSLSIPPMPRSLQAIGYIVGFDAVLNKPQLVVKVDCGGHLLQKWRFPLNLISTLLDMTRDLGIEVSLPVEEEQTIQKLRSIGGAFRARQKRFCFTLEKLESADTEFVVSRIRDVDTQALAALYSRILQQDTVF